MFQVCHAMAAWLRDPGNVVAVHCKAGKGRTGTIVACFLLYTQTFSSAEASMAYFAARRSNGNVETGTIPYHPCR
jgi:protein-tyrosine phosphatase